MPVLEYWEPREGVVNKQIKIESNSEEEYEQLVEKLKAIPYYTESVIKTINNPSARVIKFKDQRKITVGVSRKDIMNCRGKKRKAFDNCFAIIIRFMFEGAFREIHVKIFATGKLEIPGILNERILEIARQMLTQIMQPHFSDQVDFIETNPDENVLINSNFNCGYYINRDKLYSILREKYGIETAYDPCIYPGIKCKFYFNRDMGFETSIQNGRIMKEDCGLKMSVLNENKKYTEVSFMIFRTGSCLIVGNCTEQILNLVYDFIKNILAEEYLEVCAITEEQPPKIKKTKPRKKMVSLTADYFQKLTIAPTANA